MKIMGYTAPVKLERPWPEYPVADTKGDQPCHDGNGMLERLSIVHTEPEWSLSSDKSIHGHL
jgi:hypothetical protein